LKLLLDHLELSTSSNYSLYLAQCSLPSLPKTLQADLTTPQIVLKAGRGDIYDSSLWLGRPPTYTPLHRDPNPNLLMQLAGRKIVRLFPPDIGLAIFERVQQTMGQNASAIFRGEEMMQGAEKELLEREVWDDGNSADPGKAALRLGLEARIKLGEALFIPKGWWHSVKGVGEGVTASVNWWFR
jgi:Cupin-like domain